MGVNGLTEVLMGRKPVSDETRKRMADSQLKRRGWEKDSSGVLRKPCSRCKVILDVTHENFSKDRSRWSGFSHRCRKCDSEAKGVVRTPFCFICGVKLEQDQPSLRGEKKHIYPHTVCSQECLKIRKKMTQLAFNLWRKYRLTMEDYSRMLEAQRGCCAICKKDQSGASRNGGWLVDHDHKTGKVRGLLCLKCNSGLGLFQDSVEALRAAADYLDRSV